MISHYQDALTSAAVPLEFEILIYLKEFTYMFNCDAAEVLCLHKHQMHKWFSYNLVKFLVINWLSYMNLQVGGGGIIECVLAKWIRLGFPPQDERDTVNYIVFSSIMYMLSIPSFVTKYKIVNTLGTRLYCACFITNQALCPPPFCPRRALGLAPVTFAPRTLNKRPKRACSALQVTMAQFVCYYIKPSLDWKGV